MVGVAGVEIFEREFFSFSIFPHWWSHESQPERRVHVLWKRTRICCIVITFFSYFFLHRQLRIAHKKQEESEKNKKQKKGEKKSFSLKLHNFLVNFSLHLLMAEKQSELESCDAKNEQKKKLCHATFQWSCIHTLVQWTRRVGFFRPKVVRKSSGALVKITQLLLEERMWEHQQSRTIDSVEDWASFKFEFLGRFVSETRSYGESYETFSTCWWRTREIVTEFPLIRQLFNNFNFTRSSAALTFVALDISHHWSDESFTKFISQDYTISHESSTHVPKTAHIMKRCQTSTKEIFNPHFSSQMM